jgi:hypothetical protein
MATHQDIDRARHNGRSSNQFFQGRPINADRVVDLLIAASEPSRNPFLRRAANAANASRVQVALAIVRASGTSVPPSAIRAGGTESNSALTRPA